MASKRIPSGADNFIRIKGINRAVERRLHEAGIATYAKLASLTPHDLSAILVDLNGVTTKRIIKEHWINQARELSLLPASAGAGVETISQENLPAAKNKGLSSFVVELLLDEKGGTKRTKVMDVDNGIEDGWDGWQERRLLDFIVERTGLCLPAPEDDLPRATPAEQTPEAKITPDVIPSESTKAGLDSSAEPRTTVPPQAIEMAISADRPAFQRSASMPAQAKAVSGMLCANQPFAVHLALDHTGIASLKMRALSYKANIYAKSLKGALRQSVGEADGQLEPTDTATIIIKGNPLPQGFYRLQAVVGLLDPTLQSERHTSSILQTGEKLLQVV